jgi:hypothetical protein
MYPTRGDLEQNFSEDMLLRITHQDLKHKNRGIRLCLNA